MAKKMSDGAKRTRNWVFVLYPESAPSDWTQRLGDLHVQIMVSPLHTDLNPDESEKKPHHHIMLMFDSVKTYEQVLEITDSLNCPHPQRVNSLRGQARYLCHLDNPEKKQYDPADVLTFCGVDYHQVCALASDKYLAIGEMMEFVSENNIVSFAELMLYARSNNEGWFRVLCDSSAMVMIAFIKSNYWAATCSDVHKGHRNVSDDDFSNDSDNRAMPENE